MRTSISQRRDMVDKANKKLGIKEQCQLMSIHRSGYYYQPKTENELNLELMALIVSKITSHSVSNVFPMAKPCELSSFLKSAKANSSIGDSSSA